MYPYRMYNVNVFFTDLPTYEEAVGTTAEIRGTHFRPHYPVYRRNDSTASALSSMNQT